MAQRIASPSTLRATRYVAPAQVGEAFRSAPNPTAAISTMAIHPAIATRRFRMTSSPALSRALGRGGRMGARPGDERRRHRADPRRQQRQQAMPDDQEGVLE